MLGLSMPMFAWRMGRQNISLKLGPVIRSWSIGRKEEDILVPKLKRPSRRNEGREKICIPIVETTVEKAIRAIEEAKTMADLIELRVDYLRKPKIASLLGGRQNPFIGTNR